MASSNTARSRRWLLSASANAWAVRTLKLVVEPGGAVGLACVRNAQLPTHGRTVVVVLTGGNIDMPVLQSILTAAQGSAA